MLKVLLAVACVFLTACDKFDYGHELTESAVVEDLVFAPSQHGSGSGFALDGKGRVGPAFTSIDIPQKYAVVFHCQHGKFVIQGEGERYQKLWSSFSRGDAATIRHREQYRLNHKDGTRTLVRYDFIGASK